MIPSTKRITPVLFTHHSGTSLSVCFPFSFSTVVHYYSNTTSSSLSQTKVHIFIHLGFQGPAICPGSFHFRSILVSVFSELHKFSGNENAECGSNNFIPSLGCLVFSPSITDFYSVFFHRSQSKFMSVYFPRVIPELGITSYILKWVPEYFFLFLIWSTGNTLSLHESAFHQIELRRLLTHYWSM